MRTVYEFTPDERRVVISAYERYMQVLSVIGDLHGLKGQIAIAQDFSGFVAPDLPPAPIVNGDQELVLKHGEPRG